MVFATFHCQPTKCPNTMDMEYSIQMVIARSNSGPKTAHGLTNKLDLAISSTAFDRGTAYVTDGLGLPSLLNSPLRKEIMPVRCPLDDGRVHRLEPRSRDINGVLSGIPYHFQPAPIMHPVFLQQPGLTNGWDGSIGPLAVCP